MIVVVGAVMKVSTLFVEAKMSLFGNSSSSHVHAGKPVLRGLSTGYPQW